jgi:VWFA-related protein
MRNRFLLSALLIARLASVSLAQQPAAVQSPAPKQRPEDVDVVRITSNLVQVDAVVTDKKGTAVTDLKPEEIQIFEDGRQQKITHFSYNLTETSAPERPAAILARDSSSVPPARLKREDIKRTIAIVVDDLGLSAQSIYFVRRALKKFVDEQMQPGDLVAIIRTGAGMGALQQFTADKRQLYAAIERVKWNSIGRSGIAPFAPLEPATPGEMGPEIDAHNEEVNQIRQDMFAVGTLGAISYVVKGLKELPGRKSILLVSEGFRIYNLDDPTRDYLARDRLHRLIDEAGRASVVIYTMNASGLQTLGLTAADSTEGRSADDVAQQLTNRRNAAFETQEGLEFLARETGGIAIKNTNDMSAGIRRILEDQKGFYLIGYRPDDATFNPRTGQRTFHKLSLKITRPGKFNVRMRNGFFGVTDQEQQPPQTLAQKMMAALTTPFDSTGVPLQLTSLFANDAKQGSYMRSILYVDAHALTFTEEANHLHKCVFDIVAITFGDNGTIVGQPTGKTFTVQLPDDLYQRAIRDGLVYYLTVPIKKPGAYQLRLSLRDSATERMGSASQFVEVPDLKKNRLALSGLVLRGISANQTANQPSGPGPMEEGVDQGNANASPAVRHFKSGMLLEYAFVIYDARVDKTTSQPQLTTQVRLFHDGKVIFSGKENPYKPNGPADFSRLLGGGAIQLGTDLAAGEYVMQIIVNDALADQKHRTATQWMDFEIVK